MSDIFGREEFTPQAAVTADNCAVSIDGNDQNDAYQVQLEYSQQVTRRHSVGNKTAVIYSSQPTGRITIGRLVTKGTDLPESPTFKGCGTGTVVLYLYDCEGGNLSYTCAGCIASSYSIQLNAEDLTVVDGVTIDFLQLIKS